MLRQDEASALLDVAAVAADDASPTGVRDVALLEVLYASGIRVSELCGLDIDDVDWSRRVLRVLGKGAKERMVPIGIPAVRALERWLDGARAALVSSASGPALFLGAHGAVGSTPGRSAGSFTSCSRTSQGHLTSAPTASAIRLRPTYWREEPTSERFRNCSVTLRSHRRRFIHTCPLTG